MKKFKKILTAAVAAAITLTATSMAASAMTISEPGTNAYFHFVFGYAEMENTRNTSRYASAKVEIKNKFTDTLVKSKSDKKIIGLNGTVYANIDDDKYEDGTFKSICSGSIYSGGSPSSPIEWAPSIPVIV